MKFVLIAISLILVMENSIIAQEKSAPSGIYALQINVVDMQEAEDFYKNVLEFEILTDEFKPGIVILKNKAMHILLKKCESLTSWDYDNNSKTNLNLYVEDVTEYRQIFKDAGVRVIDDTDLVAGVGKYYRIADPSGNQIDMMELGYEYKPVTKPTLYNIGSLVIDMKKSRLFYEDLLGFEVLTDSYYPPVIPYKKRGVQLVLHEGGSQKAPSKYPDGSQMMFSLIVKNLNNMLVKLEKAGFKRLHEKNIETFAGKINAVLDPNGIPVQFIEWQENEIDRMRQN